MIRVREIKIDILKDNLDELRNKISKRINEKIKKIEIVKKSIDARDKNNVFYVYEVNVEVDNEDKILNNKKIKNVDKVNKIEYVNKVHGNKNINNRPIIVGSGPSGLFCALILAENGYKPIVIERGEKIEDRVNTVEEFWNTGKLNKNSNVCFGEGGAGTFSDGKLNTLVNDKEARIKKIFETFVECGASEEILYSNKPHIGTDVLRKVIINLRNKIINLGGEFRYSTCLTDIVISDNKITKIIVNDKEEIDCDVLVLAIGHSAVDTVKMLYDKGINIESKDFAIGVRIQHNQEMINKSQYGKYSKYLPPASYKLTYKASNNRGVYTFCMCPGGYVVNSSTDEDKLVINGMSYEKRDSENANSAVVVTINKNDFGKNPLDGIEYLSKIEKEAYMKGNGKIPVQLLKDYKENKISKDFKSVKPLFKGDYSFANLNEILPVYVNDSIKEALDDFDKKIKGFANDDSILAGVETRTSSAVRIKRDENYISNILGIYPAGEGSGYSGGITTSAIDGIKVSEKIIEKYSNNY